MPDSDRQRGVKRERKLGSIDAAGNSVARKAGSGIDENGNAVSQAGVIHRVCADDEEARALVGGVGWRRYQLEPNRSCEITDDAEAADVRVVVHKGDRAVRVSKNVVGRLIE